MRSGPRLSAIAIAVGTAMVLAACSGSPQNASPRVVPLPRIATSDDPTARADKLARYIEARWPRILIQEAEANDAGSVVAFNDLPSFDYSIKDPDEYVRHVQRLTGDLDQASVELLKLSARYFPELEYATVWQDQQLQAFWTKEQIVAMGDPESYRGHRSFLRLIFSAQYPPDGSAPPAPTS
jgi:hypothetical protein